MADKEYFKITISDYAAPGFCSGSKPFFGSIDEIRFFIESVKKCQPDMDLDGLQKAFSDYMAGDKLVKHSVAYGEELFLSPVQVLKNREINLNYYDWVHTNIWGFPYFMRSSKIEGQEMLVQDKNVYFKCATVAAQNLEYKSERIGSGWMKLIDGFWGFPGTLVYDKNLDTVSSSLWFVEKRFESLQEAMEDFVSNTAVEFECFCEEIFGDG